MGWLTEMGKTPRAVCIGGWRLDGDERLYLRIMSHRLVDDFDCAGTAYVAGNAPVPFDNQPCCVSWRLYPSEGIHESLKYPSKCPRRPSVPPPFLFALAHSAQQNSPLVPPLKFIQRL